VIQFFLVSLGAFVCAGLVIWIGLLVIQSAAFLVGIGFDDGPDLCIGRLMCRMRVVLVVPVLVKQVSVGCTSDAAAAETVDKAHIHPSFRQW
jgi:hypothetical protein